MGCFMIVTWRDAVSSLVFQFGQIAHFNYTHMCGHGLTCMCIMFKTFVMKIDTTWSSPDPSSTSDNAVLFLLVMLYVSPLACVPKLWVDCQAAGYVNCNRTLLMERATLDHRTQLAWHSLCLQISWRVFGSSMLQVCAICHLVQRPCSHYVLCYLRLSTKYSPLH